MERVTTGIEGLDILMQGGFPKGYTILLSGAPGTGKSIFSLQFLYEGAKKGEKGVYILFEQSVDDLIVQGELFGWDIRGMMKSGLLNIVRLDIKEIHVSDIMRELSHGKYDRAVIDSLSAILLHPVEWKDMDTPYIFSGSLDEMIPDPKNMIIASRILLNKIMTGIKESKCTTLVLSELTEGSKSLSRDTISEFLVDGIITMHYTITTSVPGRNLMIRKMRATKHSEMIHPIEFVDKKGLGIMSP